MATYRTTVSSGQPFNLPENNVLNSVSGSWTRGFDALKGFRPVRVQGIYWTSVTPGAILRIRDIQRTITGGATETPGAIWYEGQCFGGDPAIDLFPAHLTLFAPFEYYDSEGGNSIIIYGEYV